MIVKSVVKAIGPDKQVIDEYEYDRPLDRIGKDCLQFWMECTSWLHPECSFECHNYHDKDRTGETFSLPKEINERSLF